jgi:predicted transcriptional regulator YdeE
LDQTSFMETVHLESDINVFGFEVKTFPNGITEAFDLLMRQVPGGLTRSYFGVSSIVDGRIVYAAAVEEKNRNEAQEFNYQRYTISKGVYNVVTIKNWRQKLASIKDVFHEMMQDKSSDLTMPCVEWYKDEQQMECMVKRI